MRKYILTLAIAISVLLVSIPLWIVSGVALESRAPTAHPIAQPTATYRVAPGWEDMRVEPVVRTTAGNYPSFDLWYGNTRCYTFDDVGVAQEKEIFFTLQMPHSWRLGSPIHPHVHWSGSLTGGSITTDVTWVMEYTFAEPLTGVFTDTTTIITGTLKETFVPTTTKYVHNLTELTPVITPTTNSDNVSSILLARVRRASASATDVYTGSACLLYLDFHYVDDSPSGSIGEYSK